MSRKEFGKKGTERNEERKGKDEKSLIEFKNALNKFYLQK